MITLAVCDDKTLFRKNIIATCHLYFEEKGIDHEIYEYASGEELLLERYPDILLLDVRMKRLSGIVVKDILAKLQAETKIIFVAENKNDITEAFGRNVYGYLLKPLKYDLFCKSMDKVLEDIQAEKRYIFCKTGGRYDKVYYKNILYVETAGKSTKVHVQGAGECKMSDMTLGKWEELLAPHNFLRCSKRHIVNMIFVIDVNRQIELAGRIMMPLGEPYKKQFMEKYYENQSRRAILCRNA